MGFGPWLNSTFGRRCEAEKTGATTKNVVDAATNGHEFLKQVQGSSNPTANASSNCSLRISQAEATVVPVPSKPPRSPMHSKLGLPPRPPCQQVSGFQSTGKIVPLACGPDRGVFQELAIDKLNGQMQTTPATVVFDVHNSEFEKHREASLVRRGSSFQNSKAVEGSLSGSSWHSKVLADCSSFPSKTENGGVSSKQQPIPDISERENTSATLGQHTWSDSNVTTGRMLEDGVGEPVHAKGLSSTPNVDLQLKFGVSRTETSNNGSVMLAASLKLPNSMLQQSITEGGSHCGKMKVNKQVMKASTSETLPWELFIEPAGASVKAREQFVEVYKRARDELKNQRLSQSTSKTLGRELDGGPKLTLGPNGGSSNVRVEWQSCSQGQESSGPMQSHGKTTTLEHQILPHSSSLKEPTSMTAADSSHCKQVEGFRRVHTVLEGPLRSSHKTAKQEGNMEVCSQRMGVASVIQGKESRTRDKEGPSNPVCDRKDSVSKLGKDIKCSGLSQDAGESQKQMNGQEAIPVLGKRSRVTFEDQTVSLGGEKDAASRPRPQSRPQLWLQRWQSTPKYKSIGSSADTEAVLDDKSNDSRSYQSLGLRKFKDEDGIGVFGQAMNSIERVKCLKTSSSKVLPSAAAMAIVGTAARQFCSYQPQGKGSFAFWSGFGMPSDRKVEPVLENGKEKVYLKANESLPNSLGQEGSA